MGPSPLSHSVNEPRSIEALETTSVRRPLNYANSSFTRAINYWKRERERVWLRVFFPLPSLQGLPPSPSLSSERKKRCNYGQSSLMKEGPKLRLLLSLLLSTFIAVFICQLPFPSLVPSGTSLLVGTRAPLWGFYLRCPQNV